MNPLKHESKNDVHFELERIIFFSDAVFAIAITLLAIELKVPELEHATSEQLLRAVLSDWSHLFAFALSFWIIALFWLTHHRYFRYIKRYDGGLIWRNFAILFFIALMPFTTLIMGEYGDVPAGVWLYAINMLCLGLASAWLWRYASYKHRLVDPELDDNFIRSMWWRGLTTPLIAVIVFVLSIYIASAANTAWALIWVVQIFIRRYLKAPLEA